MPADDHHSEYLTRTVAALTPGGRARAVELLVQLQDSAAGDEPVVRFAADRRIEVELGRPLDLRDNPAEWPGAADLERLQDGFAAIRDQEPRDDVADWANAIVALLGDVRAAQR